MTDIENIYSSMKSAFNSSPTPGDEASAIDLNNDKTLKWRRHFNNQYAKKSQRKSLAESDSGADDPQQQHEQSQQVSIKRSDSISEEDKGQILGSAATPKTPASKQRVEERTKSTSTPPSTPDLAPAASIAATVVSSTTLPSMQSAAAQPDNDVINGSNRDEASDAQPSGSAVKSQKTKKSPRTVQENPSRRSNRTRTVTSPSPAPVRRRGRSKKVESLDMDETTSKEKTSPKDELIETEIKSMSLVTVTDKNENNEDQKTETDKPTEVIEDTKSNQENELKKEDAITDSAKSVSNGESIVASKSNVSTPKDIKDDVSKDDDSRTSTPRGRKRRSVRLETKIEPAEASAEKPPLLEIQPSPAEKIPKQTTPSPTIDSLKKDDVESTKPMSIESPPKITEKIPKKRGRRAKVVPSPATSSSDTLISSTNTTTSTTLKKSQRLTKDSTENIALDKAPPREKVPTNSNSSTSTPKAAQPSSQRPLRRIKPTHKILENEELRYEFESKNIARIVATTAGVNSDINKPAGTADVVRSSRSRETRGDPTHADSKNNTTPNKKKSAGYLNCLNIDSFYPPRKSVPCPDPQEFLNEIKAAGINLNRSPEDKKLNKKQHRKLLRQKEKMFERLGLRRNNQQDVTESENSSSDNEEFIPKKKVNVGKPNVTLRIRNNKENATESSMMQVTSNVNHQQALLPKKVGIPGVGPPKETAPNLVPAKKEETMICSCQAKPKFYARKSSEVVYCKAIDHVEDHRVGCFNKIQSKDIVPLYRPSARVPYLLLCDQHLVRFRSHNSCAGCGVFCTQGSFILCKHEHFFHPGCAQKFILNTPYDPSKRSTYPSPKLVLKCPHCGCDTSEKESLVTMKCQNTPVFLPSQKGPIKPAKMGLSSSNNRVSAVQQQPCLELSKYIPESVMNVVAREGGASLNDFTTKDMFYAINNDDLERVAEIIRSGFDVTSEMKEFLDGTCLHLVAHFGTIQMACLLLARNSTAAFLNQRDKEMRTAAMCAIIGEKLDILQLFIQVGADIALKGADGVTCLQLAAKTGYLQAAKLLVETYCSSASFKQFNGFLNAKDDGGWTALIWASELNYSSIVSLLLNYGADTSICDMENNTALHWAVMSICDESVQLLLQANVNCNVQNLMGETPLHIACRQSMTEIALMLITRGADLMVKNNDGQIPYDCVQDEENACARAVGFNMQMRSIGPTGLQVKIICSDISNGREYYPIEVVRRPRLSKINNDIDDETIMPDFKYITKSILLQNSVQIDYRVSQMRICSCNDSCNSDKCQCSTISVQNWYTMEGCLNGDFNFDDPPMIFECNDVCGCNKIGCKNRVVQNGSKIPMQVFECQQRAKGWGVRTLREIPRGTFVAEYTGEILTDMEADRRTDDSYFFDLGSSEHCIDANYYGNVSRFFNHSCAPNIVPVRVYYDHQDYRFPKIAFFACKDIAVREELAFDYGEKFWAVKQNFFSCKCESPECRFSENSNRSHRLVNGDDQLASIL